MIGKPVVSPDAAVTSERSSSSEPCLVQDQHKWTVYMSKVNLPAALNDPRLPRRETDFFTKSWGEGFTDRVDVKPSSYLPEITRDHFKKYIRKTSSVSSFPYFSCMVTSKLYALDI